MIDEITRGSLAAIAIAILLRALARLFDSISKALAERATSGRLDAQTKLVEAEAALAEREATGQHARLALGYREDARTEHQRVIDDLEIARGRIIELEAQLHAMRGRVEVLQRAMMSGGVYPPSEG